MAADVGQALAFLQQVKTTQGASIYEGLKAALAKVLEDRPVNAVEALETSVLSTPPAANLSVPLVPAASAAAAAAAVAKASLFGDPEPVLDPESGEPIDPDAPNEFECEDVEGDGDLLDGLGVGLGRQEMYAAMLAVKRLGEDAKRGVSTVRFFGKFFGTQADYYVFETTLQSNPDMPEAPEGTIPLEPYGEGVNAYIYFVSNTLGGPLQQLPYVTPEQIKASRLLRRYLTGRLDAPVSAFPAFPGNEANYLRALIARISAATVCCPRGFFTADDDSAELSANDEWVPLKGREMALPVNWSHRYAHLKGQGRTVTHKRDPPDEEEEPEKNFWTAEEMEAGPPPLATLDTDAPLPAATGDKVPPPAWSPVFASASVTTRNQVAGVRSNRWPGAVCACAGRHFTSMYVGWGIKAGGEWSPCPPPPPVPQWGAPAAGVEGGQQLLLECNDLPPKPAPPEEEDE
ncbi:hypothetical protein CHLRE_05g242550v5 [Chlamydomonas reinhardtii]|uniref:Flagellar radial spoke protein 6 n=2 Tax=Chlamydomonas reinhardtii TaxID=3055 RepID=RSP6_CHLRE|nr:uncharacterized protein CHLRE_05g242550v5 [Chlamydomonas reinhardtii]Q01657.1 RecName: Full=Flagellar radial spoke protein 6 [Chlamydomonas reinhardtii]7JR9_D Chain D, Flagellar radial spoke protein 6 [Chlamydomonas reinhardtii]7JRJ_D Chain D, Flagellar radial spoke protein 6 [Chlamydomonas reinhardtii]7JTK_K Chain K, Flagellar radial spoke protein 6 [Chlamydomonas reinhardtii]7JTK_L Chain L, Flagellar radial spoke protein 6 [Chlamydomonas reinhardtii]8GLV_IA Chain IA, Flagellar radial spo|eukprot:XP_001700729.1 radial spoke protein 6 [Chlamydomonas reinhardtii]